MFKIKKDRVVADSHLHVTGTVQHATSIARDNATWLAGGKLEEAQKSFSAILQITGGPNHDQALFELGKIDEIMKRPEGALAHYQQIMKDYRTSPLADEASVRVKTLDARKSSSAPAAS